MFVKELLGVYFPRALNPIECHLREYKMKYIQKNVQIDRSSFQFRVLHRYEAQVIEY